MSLSAPRLNTYHMSKKYLALALIILGASDLGLWLITGLAYGWLEFVVGVNAISQNGGWLMIALGLWLWQRFRAQEQSELDEILDLDHGEEVVHKQTGTRAIVTLTSQKIILRVFGVDEEFIGNYENVVSDEKMLIPYSEIVAVKPVKVKDVASTKAGKLVGMSFGISLTMKDESIYNIPISKAEIVSAHISKHLSA